jgi:hypothetical protein
MVLGHVMAGTPPLDAIPAVVAAPPGIVTYNDPPLILPRGVVPAGQPDPVVVSRSYA